MSNDVITSTRLVLIVHSPFDNYQRGDKIEDPKLIQEILNSEHANCVNRFLFPENTAQSTPAKDSKKIKE
jgi:hypothetical protein